MNSKQTLIIGSTTVDILLNIPRLPKTSEDINFLKQSLHLGGCAYNVSDVLRHFKINYKLCSPVGRGLYGDKVRELFKEKGIEVFTDVDGENSCCYCLVESDGERSFICGHGVEYQFIKSAFDKIDMATVDSAYICGLELEESTAEDEVSYIEELANFHKKAGTPFTLFFATGARIQYIPTNFMDRILALNPIIHLNSSEAMTYTHEMTAQDAAIALSSKTGNSVIITMGKQGSLYFDAETGELGFIPCVPVKIVDTVGAGDSHCGALIAGLKQGKSLRDAVSQANIVAAAVVGSAGASLSDEDFATLNL